MKRTYAPVAALLLAAALPQFAAAATTRGTTDEAKAMLAKAISHYKADGRKDALEDFNSGKPPFRDRDLYVVCVTSDHKIAANGAFPQYVGTSADKLVDAKGNPLGKSFWDAANKNPQGSVNYPMINPATGKLEDKTLFYAKLADDLLCGVGAYSGQ